MSRTALIVGIEDYRGRPLYGCVEDAKRMQQLLSRHWNHEENFECFCYTSGPENVITEQFLHEKIRALFSANTDTAVFYFAGHGYADHFGGYLVTQDGKRLDMGVSMQELVTYANGSSIAEIIIILDCCHAGAAGDVPNVAGNQALLREGVTIVASSRKNEDAMEIDGRSAFSTLFFDALEGGAADILGYVSIASIYSYVDQALRSLEQRPLFKSNSARLTVLRKCQPEIDRPILHQLTAYFNTPESKFSLDPSFEPTADPENPENEEIFGHLQQFRAARLVTPIGEEHMYYAAMNSTGCELTPVGKFYWMLVNKGKI